MVLDRPRQAIRFRWMSNVLRETTDLWAGDMLPMHAGIGAKTGFCDEGLLATSLR
jgi:hypothetical protein